MTSTAPRQKAAEGLAAEPRRSGRRRKGRSPLASVGLHAALMAGVFIALFPVAWVLLSSLKPKSAIQSSEIQLFVDPSLDNYWTVLQDTSFPQWFLNSVIVAGFTMLIGITMSATTGYALSRFNFPGRRGLMWSFLVTQMFPVAILIVPIYTIMANLGLIDTLPSLIIAYLTVAIPFCAWMMRGYFDTIPRELDEGWCRARRAGSVRDVLAGRPAVGEARDRRRRLLHVPHRLGRGRLRHRVHPDREEPHPRGRDAAVRAAVQPALGAAHPGRCDGHDSRGTGVLLRPAASGGRAHRRRHQGIVVP
jgi:hypothetical protein